MWIPLKKKGIAGRVNIDHVVQIYIMNLNTAFRLELYCLLVDLANNLTIWAPSARKRARLYGCGEPEFWRLFLSWFDIAKKTGNLFRFGVYGCRLFTNIPGMFLTDFDCVFSFVRPVKRRFLQKNRMVRSSILFFYVIFFIYGRFYE